MSGKNVERSNSMSKKACLLTCDDVPQYIREIVQRLRSVLMEFEDEDGGGDIHSGLMQGGNVVMSFS